MSRILGICLRVLAFVLSILVLTSKSWIISSVAFIHIFVITVLCLFEKSQSVLLRFSENKLINFLVYLPAIAIYFNQETVNNSSSEIPIRHIIMIFVGYFALSVLLCNQQDNKLLSRSNRFKIDLFKSLTTMFLLAGITLFSIEQINFYGAEIPHTIHQTKITETSRGGWGSFYTIVEGKELTFNTRLLDTPEAGDDIVIFYNEKGFLGYPVWSYELNN